jgi:hypothetical protein
MTENQIKIKNVGPISELTIPLPQEGGVVLLKGRNGRGKSTAISSAIALSGEKPVLTPQHGHDFGTIEGPGGFTVRIGKRTTAKGELTVHQIEASSAEMLVNPGIKDVDVADQARARALCNILRIKPAKEAWALLLLDPKRIDEAMAGANEDDAPAAAAQVKRYLQEQARAAEAKAVSDAERAKAKRVAAEDAIKGAKAYTGDAQEDSVKLALQQQSLQDKRKASLGALAKLQGVRAQLKAVEAIPLEEAQQALATAEQGQAQHAQHLEGLRKELQELQARIKLAEAESPAWQERLKVAKANIALAEARGPLQEQLMSLEEVSGGMPSDEELALVAQQLKDAKEGMAAQEMGKAKDRLEEEALEFERSAKAAEERAKDLRERAAQVEHVLFSGLAGELVTVKDGMLYGRHERLGWVRFGSLSPGERWRLAVELVVANSTKGAGTPVLPVSQEGWEALDPTNRIELHKIALAARVVILSGEPTIGDLTAEPMGDDTQTGDSHPGDLLAQPA